MENLIDLEVVQEGLGTLISTYLTLWKAVRVQINSDDVGICILNNIAKDLRGHRIQQLRKAEFEERRKAGIAFSSLATRKQRWKMRDLGLSFADNITRSEASRKIDEALGKSPENPKAEGEAGAI